MTLQGDAVTQEGTCSVLIMAGGTGGHVIPALAVASELMRRNVKVEWLGTAKGIESELVPKAGIKLNLITIEGVRGKGVVSWLKLPFLLVKAVLQAKKVISDLQPKIVLGLGGFASGPGGIAARLANVPLAIHEQNAVAGTTNRWLSLIAKIRMEAFPSSLRDAELVGNPVRKSIASLSSPMERFSSRVDSKNLLVLGGSLGALKLNQLLPAALQLMSTENRPEVWHQTGRNHEQTTKDIYREHQVDARVEAFIDDMAAAYHWADLVVCRAGALTVSELAAAGVASVLVPFPFAIDDHQTKNALWLVENDAAILRQQNELTAQTLADLLTTLFGDKRRLQQLANNAHKLSLPEAANQVAERCLALAS